MAIRRGRQRAQQSDETGSTATPEPGRGPRSPRRRSRRLAVALGGAIAVTAATLAVVSSASADDRSDRPSAIVSMGDSAASGEGARDYDAGTNGPDDFCHRSPHASIHQTGIEVDASINLACSGAASANLYIGGPAWNTEPSQADQLVAVAGQYDVRMIVVQVGANDEPAFADAVIDCALDWLNPLSQGCAPALSAQWPNRVAAMVPRVEKALGDIRQVMSDAGYADDDYDLVVSSYSSPFTENMNPVTHAFEGCPIRVADALWARTSAVPQLSDGLRTAAETAGARFVDLARATEGHEACNRLVPADARWQNGLTVALEQLANGIDQHLVQESFHPNAAGHQQFGGCLTEFYTDDLDQAACVVGADGALHAVPPETAAAG